MTIMLHMTLAGKGQVHGNVFLLYTMSKYQVLPDSSFVRLFGSIFAANSSFENSKDPVRVWKSLIQTHLCTATALVHNENHFFSLKAIANKSFTSLDI